MSPRKPIVPFSSGEGPDPDIRISKDHWERIETALGKTIKYSLRSELIEVTNRFMRFAPNELTAEPIEGAKKRLDTLKKSAERCLKQLHKDNNGRGEWYALYLIQEPHYKLMELAASYVKACGEAKEYIVSEQNPGFRSGECWNGWVRQLSTLLKDNGLPVGVRKDSILNKTNKKASAFVNFIDEMQKAFPAQYRRHRHSPGALTQAISKARSDRNTTTKRS